MKLALVLWLGLAAALVVRAEPQPGVGLEQRLGATLPLRERFHDTATGEERELGQFFRGKPVVLWFGYARCPQLCSVAAEGMVTALRSLEANAGGDFDVLMVSLDPAETPLESRRAREEAIGHYGRRGAADGWRYLTGTEAAIRAATAAAGFHYAFDPGTRQYAHPAGFVIVTPRGKIAAYFFGIDFEPRSIAIALRHAEREGIGSRVAELLLTCFRGDAIGGRYGLIIWRVLGTAVALTVVALGGGISRMLWQEQRARRIDGREGGR